MVTHLLPLRLCLHTPFAIAHDTYTFRDTIIVRMSGAGAEGYGEIPIVPYYNITRESAQAQVRSLIPWLTDRFPERVGNGQRRSRPTPKPESMIALAEEIERRARRPAGADHAMHHDAGDQGAAREGGDPHPFVTAGLSEALLDWTARLGGQAVTQLLGLPPVRARISSYTIAERDPQKAADLLRNALAAGTSEGFPLKIKCGYEDDVSTVAAIRQTAPQAELWIDCNGGWSAAEAVARARAMERQRVTLIEEPVRNDPGALQQVASSVDVPVIADESIASLAALGMLETTAPSVAGVVLKVAKLGGPLTFLAGRRWLQERSRRFMVGEMVEGSVGTAWALALADGASWVDLDAPVLASDDPADGLDAVAGRVAIPDEEAAGTGVRVASEFWEEAMPGRDDEGESDE